MCLLRLCSQRWLYPCDVRAGSWALGLQGTSLSWCMWLPVSVARPKPRLTVSGPIMRALCSWCSCDSDADASVVIVPRQESLLMIQPVTKLHQKHWRIIAIFLFFIFFIYNNFAYIEHGYTNSMMLIQVWTQCYNYSTSHIFKCSGVH